MKEKLIIKPLTGFGPLKFGATQDEVKKYFGDPQEVESLPGEAGESAAEAWNYWDIGHTVFFESDSGNRCTCFETDSDEVTLFGKDVFVMSEDQIVKLMNDNGFKELDIEDEEWGERRVSFNDAVVDFYFEDDNLISVSWGVLADENDKYNWPK
jgi:hypothetical protein